MPALDLDIDVTDCIAIKEPFTFSHSVAEGGWNAGPDTWNAAKEAGNPPKLLNTPELIKAFAAWANQYSDWGIEDDSEWEALFLQWIAGDYRELGKPESAADWVAIEDDQREGRVSSNMYFNDGRIYFSLYF